MITTQYYSNKYNPAAPVMNVTVRAFASSSVSRAITALIDSGADNTVLPLPIVKALGAEYLDTSRMTGVGGKAQVVDVYLVAIEISGIMITGIEAIAIQTNEPILGRDVLNRFIVTLDGLAEETTIRDQ